VKNAVHAAASGLHGGEVANAAPQEFHVPHDADEVCFLASRKVVEDDGTVAAAYQFLHDGRADEARPASH